MLRKYEVSVVVEIDDPNADDPETEFAAVARAIKEAAIVLSLRAEGYEDDDNVVIHVLEVI